MNDGKKIKWLLFLFDFLFLLSEKVPEFFHIYLCCISDIFTASTRTKRFIVIVCQLEAYLN